jgi:hypothetical protein
MSTEFESKFALVPVAQKTQAIATALWQQPRVRYVLVPGLVIAALGVGAWAHLRPRSTNAQPLPETPES